MCSQKDGKLETLESQIRSLEDNLERLNQENDYNSKEQQSYKSRLMVAEKNLKIIPSLESQIKV